MKKIAFIISLIVVVLSIGGMNTEAYRIGFKNVFYHSSPYDFTPKTRKYSKSSYGIYTSSLKSKGDIYMWPRANRQGVNAGYDKKQRLGGQTLPNYAVENYGYGCSVDIEFKLRTWFWDRSRSTASGSWQPDI